MSPADNRPLGDRLFTRERLTIYPRVIVAFSLLIWAATIVFGDPPITTSGDSVLPDFLAYWTGGNLVANGHASSLYEPAVQAGLQRATLPGIGEGLSWFVAPPFVAVLYLPLGAIPYGWAAALFIVLSLGALYLVGRNLVPMIRRDPSTPVGVFMVAVAASPAVFDALGAGQNSPFLLLLWVLALQQLRSGRAATAGALFATTIFKPHLVLLIPVWFLVRRNWRALGGFVLAGAALFVFPLAFFPFQTFEMWRAAMTSNAFGHYVQVGQTWKMESMSALLTDVTGWPRVDVLVLGAGALGLAWWLAKLRPDPLRDLAATSAVTVLCAPHVMLYDALLLTIPVVWLASESRLSDMRWHLLALFVVQFTTSIRHLLSDATDLLAWVDWAWAAVPICLLVVGLYRVTRSFPQPKAA